jgi:hypothetical protein
MSSFFEFSVFRHETILVSYIQHISKLSLYIYASRENDPIESKYFRFVLCITNKRDK